MEDGRLARPTGMQNSAESRFLDMLRFLGVVANVLQKALCKQSQKPEIGMRK
jgi:hypothetical protein